MTSCIIGLDFGSESARGVLIDAQSGAQLASHTQPYRHGIMSRALPTGEPLPRGWALQNAPDYLDVAAAILTALAPDRTIVSIGLGFTASTPMPAAADGTALSQVHPRDPHAYVKLWKHGAAQPYADAINARGGAYLDNFGGKLSGEWLLAKAAQIEQEAPTIWSETDRFIEAGDWVVWQLTGVETRSLSFASYKAQYLDEAGYPSDVVAGLDAKLAHPAKVGTAGGGLSDAWRQRTRIAGPAIVAVAVIDSHVVLPAIKAVSGGSFVGALGTSAAYLYLGEDYRPLPPGIEGMARDAAIQGLWCYEAGQACFGDMLAWFVRTFPRGASMEESFAVYGSEAAALPPGGGHLLALDWWNGNRVPLADSQLSGLLLGMTLHTTAAGIYRALMEALCYGAKLVLDLFTTNNFHIERVVMTSGLAQNNPALIQIMANVLNRVIEVPSIDNATAVGAAIHGAVAAGLVADYPAGAERFGATQSQRYYPDPAQALAYRPLYAEYRALSDNRSLRQTMKNLTEIPSVSNGEEPTGAEDRLSMA